MRCPFCAHTESKVIDSRPADDGDRIRRRRECLSCQKRFTTYEAVETIPMMVLKKDGSIEAYYRDKLLNSMLRACEKRQVSVAQIETAVNEIETALQNSLDREIPTSKIGELAMEKLKGIDEAAYVRFTSVYRQFKDIGSFMDELKLLLEKK
ncbi:MAG: transcriptional repressor NrdR [Oscillospiraceae bacterium]|nr:transcriptional repressor NrdR [Oscillospiraceae bacterium]MBP1556977.1 transcriptional repressor NrdR [Oscillospiraceae bacterium]